MNSKTLGHDDSSGFEFAKEMLNGHETAAVNFDRYQKDKNGRRIIFEYLLCDESQKNVTPWTSHPSKYWEKNKAKFLSLWRAALDFNATLYLVNYAKKGTEHENEILLIEVKGMNDFGIVEETLKKYTRKEFGEWFRKLNDSCLTSTEEILGKNKVFVNKKTGFYHTNPNCSYLKDKKSFVTYDSKDSQYYFNCKKCLVCEKNNF